MMFLPFIAAAFGVAIGYFLGHREGVYDEQARVSHIFDSALSIVTSGALHKVRRRVRGGLTDEEMRTELRYEADIRAARERLPR